LIELNFWCCRCAKVIRSIEISNSALKCLMYIQSAKTFISKQSSVDGEKRYLYIHIFAIYTRQQIYKHKFVQHFSDTKKLHLKETPYLTFHISKIYWKYFYFYYKAHKDEISKCFLGIIFIVYQMEIELSFEMTDSIFLYAPFIQRYLSCFSSKNLKNTYYHICIINLNITYYMLSQLSNNPFFTKSKTWFHS